MLVLFNAQRCQEMTDLSNLQRFIDAQSTVYDEVLAELTEGRKVSHWMWFIFPQLRALGRSVTAHYYGLDSVEDAIAYYQHPTLGARLRECVDVLLSLQITNPHVIFGSPDDLKLRSCLTLFSIAIPADKRFAGALKKFYLDGPDKATLNLLK
jgi:uncharacterized protein (DUF1810 family)